MRRKFWLLWMYVANSGKVVIHSDSAEEAVEVLYKTFSEDFKKWGTIYVFDRDPVLVMANGRKIDINA